MSDSQGDSGPPLLRPVPRRPFEFSYREPTPPEDDASIPTQNDPGHNLTLNLETLNSRLLNPKDNSSAAPESASLSRAQSGVDIAGSTLMGIYSQANYGKDKLNYLGVDEPTTPWGTGSETPGKGLRIDSPNYEIQKERAQPRRRRSSLHPITRPQRLSASRRAFYLGSRGLLLFSLGVLYGILATQLRNRQRVVDAFQMDGVLKGTDGSYNWLDMAFWGMSAIVMGSLLPWLDGIWEQTFGREDVAVESAADHTAGQDCVTEEPTSFTDWPLAVRGVGAFIGIAFAIRRLPWDSTLQVSLALALVNPVLWFLIDRSMTGFLLSSTVGVTGSAVLMGFSHDMVPTPANPSASTITEYNAQYDNTTGGLAQHQTQPETVSFGGLALKHETVATGIWMLSVLFCCCVCFGNIGRWLALNRGAVAKGRWAERR